MKKEIEMDAEQETPTEKRVNITVELDQWFAEVLEEWADDDGISLSEFIEDSLFYLAKQEIKRQDEEEVNTAMRRQQTYLSGTC